MIYIACPEKLATGGTELLHQLFFKLKTITQNVRIYYYNYSKTGNPTDERFLKYNVEYVTEIEDNEKNILIVPEISTNLFSKHNKVTKCIWWLSVDFYYINSLGKKEKLYDSLLFITKRIIRGDYFCRFVNFKDDSILHLSQSYYALDFLKRKGAKNTEYLSDYLGSNFINENTDFTNKNRKNRVLYNPKKGIYFTKKIISYDDNIEFIPLDNMKQDQVIELCKTSKVYIDFGNHPGKDRFPREAAHLGCIIITGKRGSAKFHEDVMIPENYKFEDKESSIPKIIKEINDVFLNYNVVVDNFNDYREMIKNEENIFVNDVKNLWDKYLHQYGKQY